MSFLKLFFALVSFLTNVFFSCGQFLGGAGSGHSKTGIVNTICPAMSTNPFTGGNGDGQSNTEISSVNCFALNVNPFSGGVCEGYSDFRLLYSDPLTCWTLPVELLVFDAIPDESKVNLIWATVSEINNDYFTVERSADIMNWESIIKVKGAGNSNSTLNYSAIDYQPLQGLSYYRLRQADYDGRYNYSDMVSVNFTSSDDYILIFPNPVTDNLTIYFNSNPEELLIIDIHGKIVRKFSLKEVENAITFSVKDFQEGTYFIAIKTCNNEQFNSKFIKIRN